MKQQDINIQIIEYRNQDYDILVDLWNRSELPYKAKGRDSYESIKNEMKRGCGKFMFAMFNNKYIGSVLVTHDGRKGWINRVCVIPEYRKHGVAHKLVTTSEQWLSDQGIGIFACQIEAYNNNSFEAFQKMGYVNFEGIRYLTKRKNPDI